MKPSPLCRAFAACLILCVLCPLSLSAQSSSEPEEKGFFRKLFNRDKPPLERVLAAPAARTPIATPATAPAQPEVAVAPVKAKTIDVDPELDRASGPATEFDAERPGVFKRIFASAVTLGKGKDNRSEIEADTLDAEATVAEASPILAATDSTPTGSGVPMAAEGPATATVEKANKRGFLKRLFSREPNDHADRVEVLPASQRRESDGMQRYPHIEGYDVRQSNSQGRIEELIDEIYSHYDDRVQQLRARDISATAVALLPSVPGDFTSAWTAGVQAALWDEHQVPRSLNQMYTRTLAYSNQIRVFSDIPLIRESGMKEADGEFDIRAFAEGRSIRRDEPIGSTLTTGRDTGRFLEDQNYIDYGVRKKFSPGTEISLSNRLSTLNNNSDFLVPNDQGASEIVLSVVQPLLNGAGYHYNLSKIKIAKLDARMASAEYIRQIQAHLLEVNRSYWAVYLARSSFLQKQSLVNSTSKIVNTLENRSDLDAIESELLRARAALAQRNATLIRAEMAVRNSEERLRALVNDPEFAFGTGGELIPNTKPILSKMNGGVKEAAREALYNRAEIEQGFAQLRAALIRKDMQKNELLPKLSLIFETSLSGLDSDNDYTGAFDNSVGDSPGWLAGFSFELPLENNFAEARHDRRLIELRQQANQLRTTIDTVLLESVVAFRETMTAFRDMQGKYQAVIASRAELDRLRERLDVDADEDGKSTYSYQLQLILDSIERNAFNEESFLTAVVAYNTSFAALDRAKGTFLRVQDVSIDRTEREITTDKARDMEILELSVPMPNGNSSGKSPMTYK